MKFEVGDVVVFCNYNIMVVAADNAVKSLIGNSDMLDSLLQTSDLYRHATPDDMRRAGFENLFYSREKRKCYVRCTGLVSPVVDDTYKLADGTYWRLKKGETVEKLTRDQWMESVKKWQGFREDAIAQNEINYHEKYWMPCSFCAKFKTPGGTNCSSCPLSRKSKYGVLYCHARNHRDNHGFTAIREADGRFWAGAAYHCDILLNEIIRVGVEEWGYALEEKPKKNMVSASWMIEKLSNLRCDPTIKEEAKMEGKYLTPTEIFEAWCKNPDRYFEIGENKFKILRAQRRNNTNEVEWIADRKGGNMAYRGGGEYYSTTQSVNGLRIKLHAEPAPDPRAARISKARCLKETPDCWAEYIETVFGDDALISVFELVGLLEILGFNELGIAVKWLMGEDIIKTSGNAGYIPTGKSFV